MTLELGFNIEHARQQTTSYISMDDSRNRFLMDAIEQLIDRETRLNTLELELDDQKESRCDYQKQCKQLREALSSLERRIEKKAFVVILIDGDGDGAIFADEFLQNSEAGGVDAAHRLREAVRHYLSEKESGLSEEDTTIGVHIWANLGGLATALYRNNSIAAKEQMFRFAEGFNRSLAEFDFINVGKAKREC
ncbi:hypothetical protein M409DRAFT_31021 [Zasmidium cellare ATCC 36951]|uniref:DUF7923 domain-containing protein n=1 Tax=Zasmidium cellare ATCC 36951 TaxID=1080233 RepID=A0A6A6BUI4_ZASCE|nr:uncharacterized protein M409DRAFT_31021 [Zasmidium cellare ATCC 36951]KAF2158464.1 hypothetical protein M409DRAFT_31021 [Zasmidium cellare ATCC 36951]